MVILSVNVHALLQCAIFLAIITTITVLQLLPPCTFLYTFSYVKLSLYFPYRFDHFGLGQLLYLFYLSVFFRTSVSFRLPGFFLYADLMMILSFSRLWILSLSMQIIALSGLTSWIKISISLIWLETLCLWRHWSTNLQTCWNEKFLSSFLCLCFNFQLNTCEQYRFQHLVCWELSRFQTNQEDGTIRMMNIKAHEPAVFHINLGFRINRATSQN